MSRISVTYALVWQIKDNPNYKFTKDGRCFNTLTGREIKRTMVARCKGFCISGKFQSFTSLRKKLVKVKTPDCPF